MKNPRLVDAIRPGDKVTIVDRFGKTHTGRAVMWSSVGGWVINLGGRYGRPALADDSNIVKVRSMKNPISPPFPRLSIYPAEYLNTHDVYEKLFKDRDTALHTARELRKMGFEVDTKKWSDPFRGEPRWFIAGIRIKNPGTDWYKYRTRLEERIYAKDKGHRWTIAQLHSFTLLELENIASHLWKRFRRRANPGTNWHIGRATLLREQARVAKSGEAKLHLRELASENEFAADASRRLGMNPIKRIRKNPSKPKPGKNLLPILVIGAAIAAAIKYGRKTT